jgi:hypothetical protein
MTTIELSPGCHRWQIGDATKHPPADAVFLQAIAQAGFFVFIGPSGLCGAKSERRSTIAIHRGSGTKWEVVFRENETDVVTTTTTDLATMTAAVISWLRGRALSVDENSLHAVAG